MKTAVDEWADFSAQQLENRLDRIWKQKQKEVSIPKLDYGSLTILLGNIFQKGVEDLSVLSNLCLLT